MPGVGPGVGQGVGQSAGRVKRAPKERLTLNTPAPEEIQRLLDQVTDPEIPVLTIRDLGILRGTRMEGERVVVTITPTYSGCPAMGDIEDSIRSTLAQAGCADVKIEFSLSPAWTTDWMSAEGRKKLRAYGIAPPHGSSSELDAGKVEIRCPQCDSNATRLISEFGSTACKALYQCTRCSEPFDYFKHF